MIGSSELIITGLVGHGVDLRGFNHDLGSHHDRGAEASVVGLLTGLLHHVLRLLLGKGLVLALHWLAVVDRLLLIVDLGNHIVVVTGFVPTESLHAGFIHSSALGPSTDGKKTAEKE